MALALIAWCGNKGIDFFAINLPGSLNFIADFESRRGTDPSNWKLVTFFFQTIFQLGNVGGIVRVGLELSISEVRKLASPAGSLDMERNLIQLERPAGICFPPVFVNKGLHLQAIEGSGWHSTDMPVVTESALVSSPPSTISHIPFIVHQDVDLLTSRRASDTHYCSSVFSIEVFSSA